MAITQTNVSSSRPQLQCKAAPSALSLGAPQVRAPRRRISHYPMVESIPSTNMSRDDPPSPPPNPPPSPSMHLELDDDDFRI
ncbi:hypothetical protein EYC80_005133 [Monilinia laxa]|uniref:Uncharacterized protein n=1 Tax=Monilinia laxa TaxID=61186 RepID=A0A5N6KJ73_MONLA|nr:hypothetical protein EYC80_005133 [Monilinia laxa]